MRPEVNAFAMRQGVTLGCVFAINFVVSTMPSVAFVSWIVEMVILWFVYKSGVKCREELMEGEMSYGAALWYVVQLFLYSSMVGGVIKYIYLKWIDTKYLGELTTAVSEVMEQMQLPAVTMEEFGSAMKEMLTPENMAIYSVAADVMLGFVVGLVMAFVLKRTNN